MTLPRRKQCCAEGCHRWPSFNVPSCRTPLYCALHKRDNMVNVKQKRCTVQGCAYSPCFNLPGQPPAYCARHKSDDMVNVKNRQCLAPGCALQPSFGHRDTMRPLYCKHHVPDGSHMVNVVSRFYGCVHCPARGIFGSGKGEALYCAAHYDPQSMQCMIEAVCKHPNCFKQPSYHFPDQHPPLFCKAHKLDTMVNVKSKRCQFEGCTRQAAYDPAVRQARMCRRHQVSS